MTTYRERFTHHRMIPLDGVLSVFVYKLYSVRDMCTHYRWGSTPQDREKERVASGRFTDQCGDCIDLDVQEAISYGSVWEVLCTPQTTQGNSQWQECQTCIQVPCPSQWNSSDYCASYIRYTCRRGPSPRREISNRNAVQLRTSLVFSSRTTFKVRWVQTGTTHGESLHVGVHTSKQVSA